MKRFMKTIMGKTTLFLAFLLCFGIGLGSVAGARFMIECDVYGTTKEEHFQEMREEEMIAVMMQYLYPKYVYQESVSKPNSKIAFVLYDENGKELENSGNLKEFSKDQKFECRFGTLYDEAGNITDLFSSRTAVVYDHIKYYRAVIYSNFEEAITEHEEFVRMGLEAAYAMKYFVYPLGILAAVGCIYIFVSLLSVAGKRPGVKGITLGPISKIPFDILVAGTAGIVIFFIRCIKYVPYALRYLYFAVSVIGLLCVILGLCMIFAIRVKTRTLIKGSWIYKVFVIIKKLTIQILQSAYKIFGCIPLLWKSILIVGGITVVEFIIIHPWYTGSIAFGGWILEKVILIPIILYIAWSLKRLKIAGEEIANGNVSYCVETKGLVWELKKHAENLNNISTGISLAVEERLKSERMKTELITNVSHDIKTPLTSIINYAGLMCDEKVTDSTKKECAEVLLRQSDKLKRLIEDLVEASKASTGNLEIIPVPCDVSVFVSQASGEYEEKMQQAGLQLITKVPEKQLVILADSRRMWRVFDNLMNNICKYSQTGTRVYVVLEEKDGKVAITFKNTSKALLNISAEELMERFVRGDASRNSEGNGLGLSIARSLTELQGGKFTLDIDGDLFKVKIEFAIHQNM